MHLRWVFIFVLLGFPHAVAQAESLPFSSLLQAEEAAGRLDHETVLRYQVYAVFDPDRLPADFQEILKVSLPGKEGTLILREIQRHWKDWSPAFRDAVSPYFLFRSDNGFLKKKIPQTNSSSAFEIPQLDKALLTGVHRMTHWAQTANFNFEWGDDISLINTAPCGVSFVNSSLGQDSCPPVPDLVKRWAEYFEFSWEKEIGEMGYREPDFAQTGLIDVFIANTGCNGGAWCELSSRTAGLTSTYCDSVFQWCADGDASYVLINGDVQTNTTASHEFFHILQFVYDSDGQWYDHNVWWMEATATWMEEQVFDTSNDYYGDIQRWVRNPEMSLRSEGNSHAYGSSLFVFHLSETYGTEIVREIWEYPVGTGITGMSVIDDILRVSYDSDLNTAFKRFTARNAVMDYEEGDGYGSMTKLASLSTYPVFATISSGTQTPDLEEWGSHYLFFTPPDQTDNILVLAFDGQDEGLWGAMVVALQKGGGYSVYEIPLQPESSGCLSLNGFGSQIEGIYMIPSVLTWEPVTPPAYVYSAQVGGSCQQILPQETASQSHDSGGGEDNRCFIATAAYGSFEAPYVRLLREFRDRYLMPSPWGRSFVETYYRFSPPMAEYIAVHPFAAFVTRLFLFPVIAIIALIMMLPV